MTTARATQPLVALINSSSTVTDPEVKAAAAALNVQVNRDFTKAWGVDCVVQAIPKGKKPPAGSWWLVLLDNSDVADALGYHDLTNENLPLGKVFVETSRSVGDAWSVTASHELLEMLADPYLWDTVGPYSGGKLYAKEVCDPCEAQEYDIDGVKVSDFVYPAYFGTGPGTKLNHMAQNGGQAITKPLTLLPGGYLSYWTPTGGWKQLYARLGDDGDATTALKARPPVGSRRERRAMLVVDEDLNDNWITSSADGTR
jgi:hypothetical protein